MRFTVDDILKRPNLYFVIILAVSLVWTVIVLLIMLPSANNELDRAVSASQQISEYCDEIFKLDPARLNYSEIRKDVGQFSYATAIDRVASKHGIRPADYDLRSEQVRNFRGNTTQGATITVRGVSISNFAAFISELLEIWTDLECENIRLNTNKDKPDDWNITVKFNYKIS